MAVQPVDFKHDNPWASDAREPIGGVLIGFSLFLILAAFLSSPKLALIFGRQPIVILELFGLLFTMGLAILYYFYLISDVASGDEKFKIDKSATLGAMLVGFLCLLLTLLIIIAFYLLMYSTQLNLALVQSDFYYLLYIFALFLLFTCFFVMDIFYSVKSRIYVKTREYWYLALFGDGVSAFAFLIIFSYANYLKWWGFRLDQSALGGAVLFQLIAADLVFVFLSSKLVHWSFAKFCLEHVILGRNG
jgi:hypothetical protein